MTSMTKSLLTTKGCTIPQLKNCVIELFVCVFNLYITNAGSMHKLIFGAFGGMLGKIFVLVLCNICPFLHLFLVIWYCQLYLFRWCISGSFLFTWYIFKILFFLWWYWILCTMFMSVIEYWKWEGGWWYPLYFFPHQSQV